MKLLHPGRIILLFAALLPLSNAQSAPAPSHLEVYGSLFEATYNYRFHPGDSSEPTSSYAKRKALAEQYKKALTAVQENCPDVSKTLLDAELANLDELAPAPASAPLWYRSFAFAVAHVDGAARKVYYHFSKRLHHESLTTSIELYFTIEHQPHPRDPNGSASVLALSDIKHSYDCGDEPHDD